MSAAFLTVTCPRCGATSSRVPVALALRAIRCGGCQARFTAPAAGDPAPAPPEPEPQPTVPDRPVAPPRVDPDADAPTRAELGRDAPTRADAAADAPTRADAAAEAPTRVEVGAEAPTRREVGPRSALDWRTGDVVLDLYEVQGVLGQGGMGRVYRVRHRGWGLDLAVKVPLPEVLLAAGGADSFEREAETWVNLGLHPHVATCHYVRRVDDVPLVFAELVDGGSLQDAMRARRLVKGADILDVAVQAAWGLHHAHEQGLVHRDVKPANVLLAAGGDARVTDFGLARGRGARGGRVAGRGALTMTVEGGGGGTPAYLSPEQATGGAMTRRSDVWSFGLTLLELFMGQRTWEHGLAAPEVLREYRLGHLALPGMPPMPDPVLALVEQCFQESPDARPRDMRAVAAVLVSAWEEGSGQSYPRREPVGGRESADGWNNRAVSLVDLGRVAEAASFWRRALERAPHHVESTYNSGLEEWTAGRMADDELRRLSEEACTSHPASARAQQLLGRVLLLLGDGAGARSALARAGELGGTDDLEADLEAARRTPGEAARPFVLRGLPGPVSALALSPDGHTVIAAGGTEARVWDADSGTLLKTLGPTEGAVRSLLAMPDGRFLLVAAENAPLTVFDLVSGRPVKTWPRHAGFDTCLALLPGGRVVVSGGSDRVVRVWDAASGRCLFEMAGHEDAVSAVAGSRAHVVSGGRDGTVRLWSVADGRPLAVLAGHEGRVGAVAIAEARSRVLSAGDDHTLRDWGLKSHELVRAYVSHAGPVQAIALADEGQTVYSGSTDRTLRGFDLDSERMTTWNPLDAAVLAVALAPDGTPWVGHGSAVSALRPAPLAAMPRVLCRPSSAIEVETRASSFDERVGEARDALEQGELGRAISLLRTARSIPGHERSAAALAVWDEVCARLPRQGLRSAWEVPGLAGHAEPPLAVASSPDGGTALTGALDGAVRVFDLASRRLLHALGGHEGAVNTVVPLPKGRAVSGGRDRTIRVWDLQEARLVRTLQGHAENVTSVVASPATGLVASGSWDGTVRLWDVDVGAVLHVLQGHEAHVAAVAAGPDGHVVASAGWDGTVRLWETAHGDAVCVLAGHEGNATAVALHPAGRSVASGGEDGTVRLWDPRSARATRVLSGHEGEVTSLSFTPDGHYLLSAGRDHTVRLWDLRRGTEVRSLPHPATVHSLALLPLGNVLLAAVADRDVHAWHLDWEPQAEAAVGGDATVKPRLAAPSTRSADATYWETVRRRAPRSARGVSRSPVAPRRVPWARVGLSALAVAAFAIGVRSWWRPEAKISLSPYMEAAVRREIDLVDTADFSSGCDPGAYGAHLERLYAGTPQARDVACLGALGGSQTVGDVLDGAPLSAPEPLVTSRLRRNAASVLAALPAEAIATLCSRLADPRDDAARVAGMALAEAVAEPAAACVRDTVGTAGAAARVSVVVPLRQLVARGALTPAEGWDLLQRLLADPDPAVRATALGAASLFSFTFAEPAARALLADPDPGVVSSAEAALQSLDTVHRADLLAGHGDP